MAAPRIIPVLLFQDKGLVKTVRFKSPVYVGDPVNTVKLFNDKEVDELICIDIDATRQGRGPDFEYLEEICSECFMPLAYAGGVRQIGQIRQLIQTGVEKVVINNGALTNPDFLRQAAETFGSSSIIAAIDIKKSLLGKPKVYDHATRSLVHDDPVEFALRLQTMGAGELFINDVDLDGTMKGYNLATLSAISQAVTIPIIACGGAGSLIDLREVIVKAKASAAAAGSLFVFHGPHKAVLVNYPSRKELNELF